MQQIFYGADLTEGELVLFIKTQPPAAFALATAEMLSKLDQLMGNRTVYVDPSRTFGLDAREYQTFDGALVVFKIAGAGEVLLGIEPPTVVMRP